MKTWNRDWLGIAVVVVALGTAITMALAVARLMRSPQLDGPIDFRTRAGFGQGRQGCLVHLELDGSATRTVPGVGTRPFRLSRGVLDELRAAIEAADFPDLKASYTLNDEGPYEVASLQLGGRFYAVSVDASSATPRSLDAVFRRLRVLAAEVPACVDPR